MGKLNVGAFLAILAFLCFGGAAVAESHGPTDNFHEFASTYESVFAARVITGQTIFSGTGTPCFYEYVARPFKVLRGKEGAEDFRFFSEAHVAVGGDYLFFFSAKSAKVYRSSAIPIFVNGRRETVASGCAKRMSGNFLLGSEIGLIKFLEKDGRAVQVVEFEDPVTDFPPSVISTEAIHSIDYDYVVSHLK